nr:vesicle transport V-SNARE 12-like [Ipomoea batatas]
MSEVFEGYERQYCELSVNLSKKCSSAALLPIGEEPRKQQVSELTVGLDEADVLIRKMDLEARSLQPSLKAALLAKLREYKSDLNKLKKEVKKLMSSGSDQAAHDALLEGEMADAHALHGVDDAIDKSKKVLTSMSRRISRNKMIVGGIIAALVLAIIVVLKNDEIFEAPDLTSDMSVSSFFRFNLAPPGIREKKYLQRWSEWQDFFELPSSTFQPSPFFNSNPISVTYRIPLLPFHKLDLSVEY